MPPCSAQDTVRHTPTQTSLTQVHTWATAHTTHTVRGSRQHQSVSGQGWGLGGQAETRIKVINSYPWEVRRQQDLSPCRAQGSKPLTLTKQKFKNKSIKNFKMAPSKHLNPHVGPFWAQACTTTLVPCPWSRSFLRGKRKPAAAGDKMGSHNRDRNGQ